MSNLFLPNKQKELSELVKEKRYDTLDDNILVFASECDIYALIENNIIYHLAEREKTVLSLCFHDGKLYDSGDYAGVFETMKDDWTIIRRGPVLAMCSHQGELYDVEYLEDVDMCSISHPPSNSTQVLTHYVSALCSFDDWVYCGASDTIFKPFWTVDQPNYRRKPLVTSLCVHKGNLYDGGYGGVWHTRGENLIIEKSSLIRSLCSHEGNLYASCNNGAIFDVFTDETVFKHLNPVQTMCSVPKKFLEDYL